MKPISILKTLDAAKKRQNKGDKFIPLFSGDAGIGKSEIAQKWVKMQQEINPNFGFIDLRLAYMEPQDFLGLPIEYKDGNGVLRTQYALPEFWPSDPNWEGLILLEEVNRGMLATQNGTMQLTTDGKVHNYVLPKGAVIAACINPEGGGYDVNSMDAALKNRFVIFDVRYDHKSFVEFMKQEGYNETVIGFVNSDLWNFKPISEIVEGEPYISPRSISKLNMLQNDMDEGVIDDEVYSEGLQSILGSYVKAYRNFAENNKPILAKDIINDEKGSLKRLKALSEDKFRTDSVRVTLDSVKDALKEGLLKDKTYFKVLNSVKSEDLVLESVKSTWFEVKCLQQDESGKLQHESIQEWLDSSKEAKEVKQILMELKPKAESYLEEMTKA